MRPGANRIGGNRLTIQEGVKNSRRIRGPCDSRSCSRSGRPP